MQQHIARGRVSPMTERSTVAAGCDLLAPLADARERRGTTSLSLATTRRLPSFVVAASRCDLGRDCWSATARRGALCARRRSVGCCGVDKLNLAQRPAIARKLLLRHLQRLGRQAAPRRRLVRPAGRPPRSTRRPARGRPTSQYETAMLTSASPCWPGAASAVNGTGSISRARWPGRTTGRPRRDRCGAPHARRRSGSTAGPARSRCPASPAASSAAATASASASSP